MTIQNNIKVINWPYKFMADRLNTMTIEKNRKLMALPWAVFLYGSLWCIVWFAGQVNPRFEDLFWLNKITPYKFFNDFSQSCWK